MIGVSLLCQRGNRKTKPKKMKKLIVPKEATAEQVAEAMNHAGPVFWHPSTEPLRKAHVTNLLKKLREEREAQA